MPLGTFILAIIIVISYMYVYIIIIIMIVLIKLLLKQFHFSDKFYLMSQTHVDFVMLGQSAKQLGSDGCGEGEGVGICWISR